MATPNHQEPLMGQHNHTDADATIVTMETESDEPPPEYESGRTTPTKQTLATKKLQNAEKMEQFTLDTSDAESEGPASSNSSWSSGIVAKIEDLQAKLDTLYLRHRQTIKRLCLIVALLVYLVYFGWAIYLDPVRAKPLIVLTSLAALLVILIVLKKQCGTKIRKSTRKISRQFTPKIRTITNWLIYLCVMMSLIIFIAVKVQPKPRQLVALGGMATFITLLFVMSKNPSKVKWRPVLWGLGLQLLLGVIILRTSQGYAAFKFLGGQVQYFLSYSDFGAEFVFGEKYKDHFFAFKVLPVIVFFSCIINTLYYLGVMQFVISKIAFVMQITMGTAPAESLTAAANIFIGQTEAPILVRPFIPYMTKSELHAIMTTGFGTIAGGVMAAYILSGVPAEHLICASVMNAPVALGLAKLFYPETEKPCNVSESLELERGKERNILEAAAAGAAASIKLVANIAANLIAFLALLKFVDTSLGWLGSMVNHPELSFQVVCSHLFLPVAYLMGVEWEDCTEVARLLGIKSFTNEFIAYKELSKLIKNRKMCTGPSISIRSEVICTYALCGFANLSSIGVQLGGIGPMAPNRMGDLAKVVLRALICGTVVCFMSACVAGLLTVEQMAEPCINSTLVNMTTLNVTTVQPLLLNTTAVH